MIPKCYDYIGSNFLLSILSQLKIKIGKFVRHHSRAELKNIAFSMKII